MFFILRSKKTNGQEYPYAKIEIAKEAADNFDFNRKDPIGLKSIAKSYNVKDAKEESIQNTPAQAPKESLNNEDTKAAVTVYLITKFGSLWDISTETVENSFIIHFYPKDSDLKVGITQIMVDRTNPQHLDTWHKLCKALVDLSKSIKDQVDENVSIQLHNPANSDRVLFVTRNDKVMSDFTKE